MSNLSLSKFCAIRGAVSVHVQQLDMLRNDGFEPILLGQNFPRNVGICWIVLSFALFDSLQRRFLVGMTNVQMLRAFRQHNM